MDVNRQIHIGHIEAGVINVHVEVLGWNVGWRLIWGWRLLRFTLFRLYLLLLLDTNKVNKVADLIFGERAICALNEVLHQVKQTQRHDDAHDS